MFGWKQVQFKQERHLLPASKVPSTGRNLKMWTHKAPICIFSILNFHHPSLLPLGLPTGFPNILLSQGHTVLHSFHLLQACSTLPPSDYIPPHTIKEEEEEEEELTSMESQGSLFMGCNISTSVPSAQAGPYQLHTPSSPSTSFIRSLCTLIEDEEEEEELTTVELQGGLFSGCNISTFVSSTQARPYLSHALSFPSSSFIRKKSKDEKALYGFITLIESSGNAIVDVM
ncbi:hypothetical protein BD769DRAFT_1391757 [Suillus cothurnatus]|nr:hypothetical protein BD769DRAFT_1391757 [Suillus cothurnatus]